MSKKRAICFTFKKYFLYVRIYLLHIQDLRSLVVLPPPDHFLPALHSEMSLSVHTPEESLAFTQGYEEFDNPIV